MCEKSWDGRRLEQLKYGHPIQSCAPRGSKEESIGICFITVPCSEQQLATCASGGLECPNSDPRQADATTTCLHCCVSALTHPKRGQSPHYQNATKPHAFMGRIQCLCGPWVAGPRLTTFTPIEETLVTVHMLS